MDRAEAHAKKYLEHLGLGPVEFEPDGNQPPDLLTHDGTAVEVRRLNKHHDVEGKPVALEYDAFPILAGMRKLLAEFGPSRGLGSLFVTYRYHRPVPQWKQIAPEVRAALKVVDESDTVPSDQLQVLPRFALSFVRASEPHDQRFLLGGYADFDSGGWLLADLQRNVQICVDEKWDKIARVRHKYARWWLVLVDHIGHGASSLEADLIAEHVRIQHTWDRVVLLSPSDHTQTVLVGPSAAAG